ncbi:hypothetical protein HWV62_41220 [Athelia sp. TMB]|nr:hypothetical protein HWV62_41220 [Athelia sp. TMB]
MAARNASPVVHHHVPIARSVEPEKRKMQRRSCKPRTTSSSVTSKAAATSAAALAAGKLGGAGTTTSEKTKTSSTSTKEAAPTKAETTKAKVTSTKTTSSEKSTKTPTSGSESYLSGTQTGEGTYFGTGLGACGITNSASDHIVAVSQLLFDTYPGYDGANPNNNPVCGKKITATYKGKSVSVTVTDRCVACAITDLDFTTSAFDLIADRALGRIYGMTWDWE